MNLRLPLLLLCAAAPSVAHAQDLLDKFPVQPVAPGKTAPKTKRAPQTQVAAKGAFPAVKSNDAALKGATSATDLAGAKKLVGKPVRVVGTVVRVYAPKSNGVVLLNFAKNYKTALVAAVKAEDFAKFPALNQLEGRRVLLSGKMVMFKGAPEIELAKAGAIKVVK